MTNKNNNTEQRGRVSERQPERDDFDPNKYLGIGAKLDVSHYISAYPDLLADKALRWVNDIDGRVESFISRGWQPVSLPRKPSGKYNPNKNSEPEKQIDTLVSVPVGNNMDAILMCKPKEDYKNQEQRALHMRAEQKMQALGQAPTGARDSGVDMNRSDIRMRIGDEN